jgi:drug/metabolite transporter (DMT)-like permease
MSGARARAPLIPLGSAVSSPYLGLVLVSLIWGSFHPLGKFIMRDATPYELILARVVFAGLTMSAILAVQGKAGLIGREIRTRPGTIALLAGFSFFASSGASALALSILPASANSLLSNTSPLFIALAAIVTAGRRTRRSTILGVAVGFVGLGLVVFGENAGTVGNLGLNPLGVGLALVSSLTWAIYIGLGRRVLSTGNSLAVVAACSLFAAVPWLLINGATGDLGRLARLPLADLGLLAYLGIVGTGVTYGIWTAALARLSAAKVAVFQYAIPFWAVILSVLLLGEQVTLPLVLGGVGIVAGIAITQRAK